MYLLDTDVISRTSPLSAAVHADVRDWLRQVGDQSYLSAVSMSEIQYGASCLIERGSRRKAMVLARWMDTIFTVFAGRLLPVDHHVARRTGELLARVEAAGHNPGFEDACIAATADLNGFVVVTQNARHFRAFGVPHREPGGSGGDRAP